MPFFSARRGARLSALLEHRDVSVAVFVDTVGAGLVLPLSLVYFTLTTDIPLARLGALSAAATLIALPAGLIGGAVTDRFGAKASMVANNLISAVGYTLYLTAGGPVGVFVAILLAAASERLYWASWTAYVHQLSAGRPFERWFSFLEAMKMGAMGIGAIASAVVLAVSAVPGLHGLVIVNIATSIAAAVIFSVQKLPPAPMSSRPPEPPAPASGRRHGAAAWLDVFRDPGATSLLVGQFLLGPLMVLPNVALSVLFITVWNLPAAVSPVLFALNTGLVAVLQTPVTRMLENVPRRHQIALAAALVIACVLPLAVLPPLPGAAGWAWVAGTGVLLAVADILYLPPTNAVLAEAPSPHVRGRAISVHQTAAALSAAGYPALIGLLHSGVPWTLWLLTSAAVAGGAGCYALALRRLPERLQRASGDA